MGFLNGDFEPNELVSDGSKIMRFYNGPRGVGEEVAAILADGTYTGNVSGEVAGRWVQLADETLSAPNADWEIEVGAYREYEMQLSLVRPSTALPYIEVNSVSEAYNGGTLRTASTTVTGVGWATTGVILDTVAGTATVNALLRFTVNTATGRVQVSGTGVLGTANTGLVYAGDVQVSSVTSFIISNGAVDAGSGSRVIIRGRELVT